MSKLPKEFVELNEIVHTFETDYNTEALFGQGYYLLLQGNRAQGYTLYLMKGKPGEGSVNQTLIPCGANKKQIEQAMELMRKIAGQAMVRTLMATPFFNNTNNQ